VAPDHEVIHKYVHGYIHTMQCFVCNQQSEPEVEIGVGQDKTSVYFNVAAKKLD